MPTNFVEYTISGPIADGDYFSPNMRKDLERGYISVNFYSDSEFQNLVSPTAGTITFTASEDGGNYGSLINGAVDATIANYDRPNFSGALLRVKATASGITGATHFKATVHKFGGV